MSFNLLEVIQNSLYQDCNLRADENYKESITITDFVDRIRYNCNSKQANLLIDITRAYLQDKFSVKIILDSDKVTNIFISGPSNVMLLEPNFLFRFIEHLPEIMQIIDAIEEPINRLRGLRVLMNEFSNRNLFCFFKYAEIDEMEKICFLTILHFYIKGETSPSLLQVCKYLPKSNYLHFLNRIENNTCILIQQDLIKLCLENYKFEKGLILQSRGIALMCNEPISLI